MTRYLLSIGGTHRNLGRAAYLTGLFVRVVVALCGLAIYLPAQTREATEGGVSGAAKVTRPNPQLTPGVIRTTDAKEICDPKFRTKPFRKTTSAMKKHVCLEYHVKPCPLAGKMEIDHLLPLELGGLDDERNLWPQMAPEFHWKDALENKLRHLVCIDKTLDLPTAQKEIMTDWPAAYQKYIGALPASP